MRVITSDHFVRWANGTGLIALGGLGWTASVPGGPFWGALLAAALVSTALASAALPGARTRPMPAFAGYGGQARRRR